ncbi:hypothetical protein PN836_019285 [Ningiella sp. W23]|uniref:hypothetical protein n=1 Tax=Ningiella sp. W23 TaxID=3023715 RepID=UPI0037568085
MALRLQQRLFLSSMSCLILFVSLATVSNSIDAKPALKADSGATILPVLTLEGKWIREHDGSTMLNPQTSGLVAAENGIWTISDASADTSQIQRLHLLDTSLTESSVDILSRLGPFELSEGIQQSCFAQYLATAPDYEAMVAHPFKPQAWILVTEDATRSGAMTEQCQARFAASGSTDFPTLLVEVQKQDTKMIVTGLRPVQFDVNDQIGNFPNDGIEGLAILPPSSLPELNGFSRLYLGLEKDATSSARVFMVDISASTFENDAEFLPVKDAKLKLPTFEQGNHPINGMDIYTDASGQAWLIAAARNDNQLWLIDLSGERKSKIIPLRYTAPSSVSSQACILSENARVEALDTAYINGGYYMHNASLEGVAVKGDSVFLVNDPWRRNYLRNVVCEQDRVFYERMSPLLFKTPIDPSWFK